VAYKKDLHLALIEIFYLFPRLAHPKKPEACEISDLLRRKSSPLSRKMSRPLLKIGAWGWGLGIEG
jgi:hypothetical protein